MRGKKRGWLMNPIQLGKYFMEEDWDNCLDTTITATWWGLSILVSTLAVAYLTAWLTTISSMVAFPFMILSGVGLLAGSLAMTPLIGWVLGYCLYLMAVVPVQVGLLLWGLLTNRKKGL